MARITDQPSSAPRRSTGTDMPETNRRDPSDDQGQREEHSPLADLGDNDERRDQGLTTERGEGRNHLSENREPHENRGDREFREHRQLSEFGEFGENRKTRENRNHLGENRERPGRGQLGERADQDQREEHGQLSGNLGDNDDRREQGLTIERGEGRNHLGEHCEHREHREPRERGQSGERAEKGPRREQRPAMSSGFDAFAPVLGAWNQVFASWFELAGTMVKVQQETFASMIGAASPSGKDSTSGEHRSRDHVSTGSRTNASTPDRIEHDRR